MQIQGKTIDLLGRNILRRNLLLYGRQNINSHEVPYARLLDSPSRLAKGKDGIDAKLSPTPSKRHESSVIGGSSLLTPKSLRIPAPKTSSSDSKLTVDYFQGSEVSVIAGGR